MLPLSLWILFAVIRCSPERARLSLSYPGKWLIHKPPKLKCSGSHSTSTDMYGIRRKIRLRNQCRHRTGQLKKARSRPGGIYSTESWSFTTHYIQHFQCQADVGCGIMDDDLELFKSSLSCAGSVLSKLCCFSISSAARDIEVFSFKSWCLFIVFLLRRGQNLIYTHNLFNNMKHNTPFTSNPALKAIYANNLCALLLHYC